MIEKLHEELADRREIERELAHMASFSEMARIRSSNRYRCAFITSIRKRWMCFGRDRAARSSHPAFEGLPPILQLLQREGQTFITRPIKLGDKIYDQQISLLDGGPRVRLYFSDITELKRLDQLKTDFRNMVSHELPGSPLTTINASVKMVANELLGAIPRDQKDMLTLALSNIERLSRLINELLDISKIEAGRLNRIVSPSTCKSCPGGGASLRALSQGAWIEFACVPWGRRRWTFSLTG